MRQPGLEVEDDIDDDAFDLLVSVCSSSTSIASCGVVTDIGWLADPGPGPGQAAILGADQGASLVRWRVSTSSRVLRQLACSLFNDSNWSQLSRRTPVPAVVPPKGSIPVRTVSSLLSKTFNDGYR